MKKITLEYLGKFIFDRTNLMKQKEELEQKLIGTEAKKSRQNKAKEEKKLDELIENFLKFEQIDKLYLYRLINKIEIDKDKNVYIYFNFLEPDLMAENLSNCYKQGKLQLIDTEIPNEFTKIEKLIELEQLQSQSS